MTRASMEFTVFHLFSGLGGGALGFQRAEAAWNGQPVRFTTLGGVDNDLEACADFATLTGAPATCLDLFARDDYTAFHGEAPSADWREATPEDLRRAASGRRPDVVFTSPPCKAFSGLLPASAAGSPKYEALSRLTVRGIALVLAAWADDLPGLILLENVPRITSRGKHLLAAVKQLLRAAGYVFDERTHDLGVVGGLAQHRRRYLLVARHPAKVPTMLYQVPTRAVCPIGAVLGPLPAPDVAEAGPLHRLPRLQWRTWVRLALIPAGGDWRDLQGLKPGAYAIEADRACYSNIYRVTPWTDPLPTVTSGKDAAIADPRLGHAPRKGTYQITAWDTPAGAVIGNARVGGSSGGAVADPRIAATRGATFAGSPGLLGVLDWAEPSGTVTGTASVTSGNASAAVADPRLTCAPRSGAYRVTAWEDPAPTVTGAADVHTQGAVAVADPRVPEATITGVWTIRALDGTWHRPLTTLELAVLQGLPTQLPDGSPLTLAGQSNARWRERIGNAVPVDAAEAVGNTMLRTLIGARVGAWVWSVYLTAVWVRLRLRLAHRVGTP